MKERGVIKKYDSTLYIFSLILTNINVNLDYFIVFGDVFKNNNQGSVENLYEK